MPQASEQTHQLAPGGTESQIRKLDAGERAIAIEWADGHKSKFHYLWLRYACACKLCGNPESGVGSLLITDFATDIAPQSVALNNEGKVVVLWQPDGHRSEYNAEWLRLWCYSDVERKRRKFRPKVWRAKSLKSIPTVAFSEATQSDSGRLEMLTLLRDYGLVLVKGGPVSPQTIEDVAARVGCIHESLMLKRVSNIVTNQKVKLITDTPMRIWPHTDQCYRHSPPGITFFQCLETAADGGGASTMADGFAIAEHLRQTDPEAFRLLSTVPQRFQRHLPNETAQYADSHIISLDIDGDVTGIRYAHRVTAAPLSVSEELIEPMYRAIRKLVELMKSEEFVVSFVIEPGDTLAFDNHRVLHGRTEYDASRGRRHLLRCEVDREEHHSNLRLLLRKAGRLREALEVYPHGALH